MIQSEIQQARADYARYLAGCQAGRNKPMAWEPYLQEWRLVRRIESREPRQVDDRTTLDHSRRDYSLARYATDAAIERKPRRRPAE